MRRPVFVRRFLRWRRYRRFLGCLIRADRRARRPLTPETIACFQDAAAWAAAAVDRWMSGR